MKITVIIEEANRLAEDDALFWVAGLVREAWPILVNHYAELHPLVQVAVTHYREAREQ